MRITIAERLRPFSHLPGTTCLLPGTPYEFRFYPTRLGSHDLHLHGPVEDFTVQQDLEKCRLTVWGHYQEGFLRYHIFFDIEEKAVILEMDRCPSAGLSSSLRKTPLLPKQRVRLIENSPHLPCPKNSRARLSLGCHRAQDWDLMKRRARLEEIFPFWFRLGMLLEEESSGNRHPLLEQCAQNVLKQDRLALYTSFKNLFSAGFEGILTPRLQDQAFQGLMPLLAKTEGSPTILLSAAARLIARLFIDTSANNLSFLPLLPPEFHCGRITGYAVPFGEVDLEWSKKTLRRLIFRNRNNAQPSFIFPKQIKAFRIRTSPKDKGAILPVGTPLDFQENGVYFFDNFTH